MRRRALWKDFFMEIKTSLTRFLSIVLIVALGVAFFAGIRATNPDMRITIDSYFDNSNLMDIRILSSMGLTEEDATAISKVEGVETIDPAYSTHVVCDADGNELVLEVMSLTKKLNQVTVDEGRLPEKEDEVFVDTYFITTTGYKIGDKIKLSSGTEAELSDTLSHNEYTIVGIGSSPYYLSFQRGSTTIGNGKVNSFIVVLPEVFQMEVYTTAYVSVKDAKPLSVYTNQYYSKVSNVIERINEIADIQCQKRYDELYNQAFNEIEKSKNGLEAEKSKENELIIKNAQAELEELKPPVWYVLDRNSIEAYSEFEQNAEQIDAIGEVFPVIFFLVAALISLTTMTRMVEEERIQIGTLKALGYSKKAIAMKYMLYSLLATIGGSAIGAVVGLKVLPTIIITAYKILYRGIPKAITPFNWYYATLATILSVFCVGLATYISCYKELLAKPAELMRPEAPKVGKRVFLERVPIIWNQLNFTWKATVRNLMRYKKRFLMTIFGIGGCMALLLVGFGVKDSIFVIYVRQFDEIMLYDAMISLDDKATKEQLVELESELEKDKEISSSALVRNSSVDLSFEGKKKSISMIVPEEPEELRDYIVFRKRVGHKKYTLNDKGVIITEQVAKKLGIKKGDTVTIKEGDITAKVRVSAITENYMTHYIYLTPDLYQNLFEKEVNYNQYILLMPDTDEVTELVVGNRILEYPAANGVFYTSYYQKTLSRILESLDIVVWVLIISAGALAFVVLYNLNNININERRRELATIKVLGFYNHEMAAYVYRENILLTILGSLFGILFGIVLHRFIIVTVEVDIIMFGRNIDFSSYIYSILLTFMFSALVNFAMYFKLKKINMVESLKSVE